MNSGWYTSSGNALTWGSANVTSGVTAVPLIYAGGYDFNQPQPGPPPAERTALDWLDDELASVTRRAFA